MLDGRSSAPDNIEKEANSKENTQFEDAGAPKNRVKTEDAKTQDKDFDDRRTLKKILETQQDNYSKIVNQELSNECALENNEYVHLNIGQVKTKTVKVPVKTGGVSCSAVVDTGAEVSVLNKEIYEKIPEDSRPILEKPRKRLVVAEAGKEMTVCGMIRIEITVAGFTFKWPVYVAPIRDDLLLGWDIIYHHKFAIDPEKGFRVKDKWLNLEVTPPKRNVACIEVKRSITVPANCEFVVSCQCKDTKEVDYIFEPVGLNRVTAAKAMVRPHKNSIPVRLINPYNSPTRIHKRTVVGYLQEPVDIQDTNYILDNSEVTNNSVSRIKADSVASSGLHNREILCGKQVNLASATNLVMPTMPDVILSNIQEAKEIDQICEENSLSLPDHLKTLYEDSLTNLKTNEERKKLADMLRQHENTFATSPTDLGRCSVLKHRIDTAGAAPIRQPMRRTPQGFEQEEEKYLKDQIDAGVIRPSNSPWSSPVVLVRKKDGGVRWCIDYRRLNDVTVKDAYPLPRIDSCLDQLSSAKIFSTLDLQSGYWQLELEESSKPKTAFISKYGLYEYNMLPFGLCGAPSTFQRCMEMILRGLQWDSLLIYLDDIIVLGSNFEEHLCRLKEVLSRISSAGLKLKPSKCELFKTEVLFLGHIVGPHGIRPNPKLIDSVKNWKEPTNVKGIQQFIGFCNYYRQFIQNFSERATPLTRLTRKDIPFDWCTRCQLAFEDLKNALCTAPVLAYPRDDCEYILDTDASDVGVGSVLSQIQEGKERVVAFASKKLNRTQQRYSVTRRELLAMVTFTHHFRHYLLGKKFLLRTDHGSLRWLFNFKDPRGQVARWIEALSLYSFDIQHRPGRSHQNADSMSRKDYVETACAHENAEEIEQCLECLQTREDWQEFMDDIDTVVDLGVQTEIEDCCRALTRQQFQNEEKSQSHIDVQRPTIPVYLPNYSTKDIGVLQREDPDLGYLHEWIDRNQIPTRDEVNALSPAVRKFWLNWDNIVKLGHVLYQKIVLENLQGTSDIYQLLVPKVLRKEVLKNCHDSLYGGHSGVNKTVEKVRKKFYWYRYKEDIRLHIAMCDVCKKASQPVKLPRAPLQQYRAGYPLDRIGLDIMGPLRTTKNGNKYILVIGDYFTRWMEAYSLPSQKTEEVATKLVFEFVCRFGLPYEIHSDQGRNFESDLFQEICRLLNIKKTRTTSYRPCSNGLIERFNGTLGRMLKKFVDRNNENWDQYIGLLLAAYRSTPHSSTGYSPNMMMLGREVTLPVDVIFPLPQQDASVEEHEYVANLREKMEECFTIARKQLHAASNRQKRDYDSRMVEHVYKKGDVVYKKCAPLKKLDKPWDGPYIILKMLSPSVYLIQGRRKTYVTHHDRLKPCGIETGELPKWAKKVVKNCSRN